MYKKTVLAVFLKGQQIWCIQKSKD